MSRRLCRAVSRHRPPFSPSWTSISVNSAPMRVSICRRTLARVKLLPEALELMAKYEDEARDTLFPLLSTNRVRIDLITICKLVETSKTPNYVFSKALQDKLEVMNKSPQKKVVTHRFEPTSKNVLLFIGGLALSLVISIWGNLTQWRDYQDWEEADLKYRALKMVLPADDPNIRYIEKYFHVQRDGNIIDNVRKRITVYKDSIRTH